MKIFHKNKQRFIIIEGNVNYVNNESIFVIFNSEYICCRKSKQFKRVTKHLTNGMMYIGKGYNKFGKPKYIGYIKQNEERAIVLFDVRYELPNIEKRFKSHGFFNKRIIRMWIQLAKTELDKEL